jgi:hypothetical protein
MRNFKVSIFLIFLVIFLIVSIQLAAPGNNARRPAIVSGSNQVVQLQRTNSDWEGTWYWYVGSTYNATNLTGVTALGLLEAYQDTKDLAYLDSAMRAADFIMTHLGAGATGTIYHVRTTAPDIIFLHRLAEITGDFTYSDRANFEWDNIKLSWETAGDLDSYFRTKNRPSAWDIAFYLEAAHLSGDNDWADDAATILADTEDDFYYGDTWWYALNVAGSIRALVGCGYYTDYQEGIVYLLEELISKISNIGIDGYIQDTAYAVLAFSTVGGQARSYANDLGRWLSTRQETNGGWIEAGYEYPEINGEAVRGLASTIGINNTLGEHIRDSSWVSSLEISKITNLETLGKLLKSKRTGHASPF